MVTGANIGLGLEAARHFTRLNAEKVILAVRNLEKGNEAKKSIEESTHRTGVVDVWELDLSIYQSVEQFAAKAQNLERLDVLVENAGINAMTFDLAEGQERTITGMDRIHLLSQSAIPAGSGQPKHSDSCIVKTNG